MRLSDAGLRRHPTKLIYPDHRPTPWLIEDATPRSLEPIVRRRSELRKRENQGRPHCTSRIRARPSIIATVTVSASTNSSPQMETYAQPRSPGRLPGQFVEANPSSKTAERGVSSGAYPMYMLRRLLRRASGGSSRRASGARRANAASKFASTSA
jgi:hypothetical protein